MLADGQPSINGVAELSVKCTVGSSSKRMGRYACTGCFMSCYCTFSGEWYQGCMHGIGTFESPDGSKYQGSWFKDLKHGLGKKVYANGDVYEGLWKHNKPDGPGRWV